jgi:hypothetical protein
MGQTPFAKMTRNRKQRFETLPAILFFNFIEKQRTRRSQTFSQATKKKAEQHQERIKIHQSQSGQTTHLFLDLCRGVRQKQHNQGNHRAWKGILQEPQGGIHKANNCCDCTHWCSRRDHWWRDNTWGMSPQQNQEH